MNPARRLAGAAGLWALSLSAWALGPAGPDLALRDLHGRFVQTKAIAGLSAPLRSSGSFSLLAGKGLVWRTERPLRGTVVLTAKGAYALDNGARRRLSSGSEALALMDELLAGDAGALAKAFTVTRRDGPRGWSLELVPRPGPLAALFQSIEAQGDGGAGLAREARLLERTGDETRIRFEAVAAGAGNLDPAEGSLLAD
jgi:hypothetical protein